ncbi:MAG TPA: pteridine reductase [Gammaproteobacteria bacterium]|nr:pteridine reductase [Gammaproteobacteria bacterium]
MDKVALVTGGARRLGAAITHRLHADGWRVVVHCQHSTAEADALAAHLEAARADSACVVQADLADAAAAARLVAAACSRWGRLDALVNNAAVFESVPLAEVDLAAWQQTLDVNLRAPFLLAQAAAGALAAHGGAIVNLTDIYADRPKTGFAVYCVSKAGLAGLTRVLARELAPAVRVNAVAPGAILWPAGAAPADKQALIERTPLARCGVAADIADAVAYLLGAGFVTGQILAVDGGRSLND